MPKNLTRMEMLALLRQKRQGDIDLSYLNSDDRELLELMETFYVADDEPLLEAPAPLLNRVKAIPGNKRSLKDVIQEVGRLVFDSWAMPGPVGVRGSEAAAERRLQFEAADLKVDLRAERDNDRWNFVARISSEGRNTDSVSLQSGKRKHSADPEGYIHWSGKRPPRTLKVHTDREVISLPEISWQHKKTD
jgi:hypothetical protein